MRALVNSDVRPNAIRLPCSEALEFHAALSDYEPTTVRDLPALAAELGLDCMLKDESDRLGLPAFKVLGASWAIERALRKRRDVHTLIAASAGNHGRAVAHIAAARGLRCRILLPAKTASARRDAIAAEGAEVVIIDGDYQAAVAQATNQSGQPGVLEIADIGDSPPARWVIDGYTTLFAEAGAQAPFDVLLVPVGVGALAAAAARFAAQAGIQVIGIEPAAAACLTASLAAGQLTAVPTPGTTMTGLDCAEVSTAAWPCLRAGIHGTITVDDAEVHAAMRELAQTGLAIGECGAAPLAALRALVISPDCSALRKAVRLASNSRVMLIATEGPTDPASYRHALS